MPLEHPPPPERLYTWIDIEEHLSALAAMGPPHWPDWLLEADAYWDCLELRLRLQTSPDHVFDWLEMTFGINSVRRAPPRIVLDDVTGVPPHESTRSLEVSVVPTGEPVAVRRVPRLREPRVVGELVQPLPRPASPAFADETQIVALHSFKGGVGRTLQALALARALARREVTVLLVDADLEAPGITWMLEAQGRRIDFAYDDFLALLQGSTDGSPTEAVTLGRAFLPNQKWGAVTVMPATRRTLHPLPPRIEPADLLTPDRSPYFLTESLAELAAAIGCAVVVADLRAGSTELSAPLLLDPRVQRIFVTTLSYQSLEGMVRLIRELGRRAPTVQGSDPPAMAVITQFRERDHDEQIVDAAALLRDALESTFSLDLPVESWDDSKVVDADVFSQPLLASFQSDLLALPGRWDDVIDLIDGVNLPQSMDRVAQGLRSAAPSVLAVKDTGEAQSSDLNSRRQRLAQKAESLVHAETASVTEFLVTDSLRNLLTAHRTEPPIAVAVGAKGSGKTFTFIQMCLREVWQEFAKAAQIDDVTLQARIVPVLSSHHLGPETGDRLQALRRDAAEPGGAVAEQLEVRDLIRNRLIVPMSDSDWRHIWLTCLARTVGVQTEPEQAEQRLADLAQRRSLVFLIDGLEDLFQDFTTNSQQQQALRVLLTDCLDWMRTLRGRPFGLAVFVRRDLVGGAIRQNMRQFLARHAQYELKWNAEEALRLVLWACQQSTALPGLTLDWVQKASGRDLTDGLVPVWGEKMGGPKSREARSDQWFLAALSDFNQQIQARDIVFFLAQAAKLSDGDKRWTDRLLTPAAMRNALLECSKGKIAAIRDENPRVGELLARLRDLTTDRKKIPFDAGSVDLNPEELEILEANGVVFREQDMYWIPEIFRHGLGFRAVGRPRILAVANLVRHRNNLD